MCILKADKMRPLSSRGNCGLTNCTIFKTSKTRFYKLPAAAKVFLGLNKIEGKGKLVKT